MKFQKFEHGSRDESAGKYLKIKDGQAITAVLRGEIYTYFNKWDNGKSTIVIEGTPGAKTRFSVNAVVFEDGVFKSRIWDFGKPVYEQLAEINEMYALDMTKIKIKRTGTGLDTTYMIMPLLKDEDKLQPKHIAEIEAVELHTLDKTPVKQKMDEPESWNF